MRLRSKKKMPDRRWKRWKDKNVDAGKWKCAVRWIGSLRGVLPTAPYSSTSMLALSEFALWHTHVKNHVSYKKIHHQIIKYIHEPLGWPFIHLTVRLLRLMTARAKSTWPLNLTTASFVFDGDVGVIDVLEVYMTSSVFSFSCVFLFLQHCRYLTFKKVFDRETERSRKRLWRWTHSTHPLLRWTDSHTIVAPESK